MLFAMHCLDRAGALPRRTENHAAHRAHLAAAKVRLFVAAGVWARVTITGFAMRADNRAQPEAA